MLQDELVTLTSKYKQNEKDSLSISSLPDDKYLCIRMDGFKATKKYLKDVLINERFHTCMYKANNKLFNSFKHYLTNEYSSSIVCSLVVNDEISIILNKDNNSDDAKKIMKLCTLFSGVLSSSMTLHLNKHTKMQEIIAFDARPLVLNKTEISEYIRYRYLIGKRYAYWKVLRLHNVGKWKEDSIKTNIINCINIVKENGLEADALTIMSTFKFYLPTKESSPQYSKDCLTDKNMNENILDNLIKSYLNYLHKKLNF